MADGLWLMAMGDGHGVPIDHCHGPLPLAISHQP
jgi:hypothetical protein